MFHFGERVKVITIDKIQIGGQPGEVLPVLIGALSSNALNDLSNAKRLIDQQNTWSQFTEHPCMVQVIVTRFKDLESLPHLLEFIETPVVFDFPAGHSELKEQILKKIEHHDWSKKIVFNSINMGTTHAELKALEDLGISNAIILAHNMSLPSADGSFLLLKQGLLEKVLQYDIPNLLIDPGSLPVDSGFLAGEFFAALLLLKSHFGWPVGGAPCNIVESWSDLKKVGLMNKLPTGYSSTLCAVNAMAFTLGADFLFYGSLDHAPEIFTSASLVNKVIYERNHRYFGIDRG